MRAETEDGSLLVMKKFLVLSKLAILVITDLWLHLASPNRKVTCRPLASLFWKWDRSNSMGLAALLRAWWLLQCSSCLCCLGFNHLHRSRSHWLRFRGNLSSQKEGLIKAGGVRERWCFVLRHLCNLPEGWGLPSTTYGGARKASVLNLGFYLVLRSITYPLVLRYRFPSL